MTVEGRDPVQRSEHPARPPATLPPRPTSLRWRARSRPILVSLDFEAESLPAARPLAALIDRLESEPPDVVFNLIEGFGGRSAGEAWITGLLELLASPTPAARPSPVALPWQVADKGAARGAGLADRPVRTCTRPTDPSRPALRRPLLRQARGRGREPGDRPGERRPDRARHRRTRRMLRGQTFGRDVLIEAYLPGREFNVGVLALPEPEASAAWPRSSTRPARRLADPHLRREMGRTARPRIWPAAHSCPADIAPELAERSRRARRRRLPGDGLPRLCPGRLPARCRGLADDPRGEPEPRHRPEGRLGAGAPGLGRDYGETLAGAREPGHGAEGSAWLMLTLEGSPAQRSTGDRADPRDVGVFRPARSPSAWSSSMRPRSRPVDRLPLVHRRDRRRRGRLRLLRAGPADGRDVRPLLDRRRPREPRNGRRGQARRGRERRRPGRRAGGGCWRKRRRPRSMDGPMRSTSGKVTGSSDGSPTSTGRATTG